MKDVKTNLLIRLNNKKGRIKEMGGRYGAAKSRRVKDQSKNGTDSPAGT